MMLNKARRVLWLPLFLCFIVVFSQTSCAQEQVEEGLPLLKNDEIWVYLDSGEALLFNVELAVTPEQQQTGLMNRTYMADDAGMLFVFEDEKKRSFWMKDTLIPLDMLFLTKEGIVHHIHHMATPQSTAHITSERPSFAVLEINGGYSDVLGIKEGNRILHPVFRNTVPY